MLYSSLFESPPLEDPVLLNIIVLIKQVIDPDIPTAEFKIEPGTSEVATPFNIPPVINCFDENALEAALRIKDSQETTVTALSLGKYFSMDVVKKSLSMGVDNLILIEDSQDRSGFDSSITAKILSTAIKKAGNFDLVLAGRQASDWDNAQVPQIISEHLGLPCVTLAKSIDITNNNVTVERQLPNGTEIVQTSLPAIITVSNELGQPRYPTLRGIMFAARKEPIVWTPQDLGLSESTLTSQLQLTDLYIPTSSTECEIMTGQDAAAAGRNLALKLRKEKLI
jgi:electron transfer flavoprotein beta subunit